MSILATAGLKLNKAKCAFLMPQVEYLGHIIDQHGLHPTKEKVKAIREAPQPHNVNAAEVISRYYQLLWQVHAKPFY